MKVQFYYVTLMKKACGKTDLRKVQLTPLAACVKVSVAFHELFSAFSFILA